MRGVEQIDLAQSPPPDLAVEVDITSSSLDRFSLYAALRVPEVWRSDGRSLTIYVLRSGDYTESDRSIALPLLKAKNIGRFLRPQPTIGENTLIKQFRQ